MRRGICVKCGAATVRAAANGIDHGTAGVKAVLRPHLEPGFRGVVQSQQADLWSFACTSCGYVEQYVLDPVGIAFIQQRWMPIPPPAGG
jgi:hypothetical protein